MTDDDITPPTSAPSNGHSNGHSPAAKQAVRSALAQRRNPVLVAAGDFLTNLRRIAFRDPLALFLAIAAVALAITFAALLGAIKPSSSGREVPLSTVQKLAKHHYIAVATLLDHDSRVELTTTAAAPSITPAGTFAVTPVATGSTGGKGDTEAPAGTLQQLWAAYPASGAQTAQLASELNASGATVTVDQPAVWRPSPSSRARAARRAREHATRSPSPMWRARERPWPSSARYATTCRTRASTWPSVRLPPRPSCS